MGVIAFEDVSVRYGEFTALSDIAVTLTEQRIALIGANGSGKSTFARLINGLMAPSTGTVTVDGLNVAHHGAEIRSQVGFVFTNPDSQIVMPTVAEDVEFSLRRRKLSFADRNALVTEILDQLRLGDLRARPAHSLSGGQKQLLALAAILVARPSLIVADEPTTLLDLRNSRVIHTVFATLPQQLIVATHDLDAIEEFDRVLVFNEGQIVADAAPQAAIAHYRALAAE